MAEPGPEVETGTGTTDKPLIGISAGIVLSSSGIRAEITLASDSLAMRCAHYLFIHLYAL